MREKDKSYQRYTELLKHCFVCRTTLSWILHLSLVRRDPDGQFRRNERCDTIISQRQEPGTLHISNERLASFSLTVHQQCNRYQSQKYRHEDKHHFSLCTLAFLIAKHAMAIFQLCHHFKHNVHFVQSPPS